MLEFTPALQVLEFNFYIDNKSHSTSYQPGGRMAFIVGPNGSGKSALLQQIALPFTLKKSPYTVKVNTELNGLEYFNNILIGNISFPFSSFFSFNTYLKLFSKVSDFNLAEAEEMAGLLNIFEHRNKRIYRCSEGTKRKFSLVFNLAWSKSIMVIDELDQYLDSESIHGIITYLQRKTKNGCFVFVCIQQKQIIERYTDIEVLNLYQKKT